MQIRCGPSAQILISVSGIGTNYRDEYSTSTQFHNTYISCNKCIYENVVNFVFVLH